MANTKDEEKYRSYLQTISIIAFVTAVIEFILLFNYDSGLVFKRGIQLGIGITSVVALAMAGFWGMVTASELSISGQVDDFFNGIDKGRAVTVLFFVHLLGVALFIIQDGGARVSSISNILLVDASLGYFFAAKKKIKRAVNITFSIVYSICLVFYVAPVSQSSDTVIISVPIYNSHLLSDAGKLIFCIDFNAIPHVFTVLFVIGINIIINNQISNKDEKKMIDIDSKKAGDDEIQKKE